MISHRWAWNNLSQHDAERIGGPPSKGYPGGNKFFNQMSMIRSIKIPILGSVILSISLYASVAFSYVPISDEQLFEFTPLMAAVAENDHTQVKALLASGSNPDTRSESGGTALMVAARSGRVELVQVLIDQGADPNNCGDYDYCPLWYAADADSLEILKLLVEAGADPKWVPENNGMEYPPLQLAVHNANLALVKYLVDTGADMEFTNYWSNYPAPTPSAVAVAEGRLDISKYLLSQGALIHEATEVAYRRNVSALEYARGEGHCSVVNYIERVSSDGTYTPKFTVDMFVKKLYSDPEYLLGEQGPYVLEFLGRISMENMCFLRNSIFARKNYQFKDRVLGQYFELKFSSYKGLTRDITVSDLDKKNINFIKLLEQRAYNRSVAS